MNLRMDAQALRFRLSEAEFAALGAGQTAVQTVCLSKDIQVQCHIVLVDVSAGGPALQLQSQQQQGVLVITLQVAKAAYADLAGRLPCRDGLSDWNETGTEAALELSLDVDTHSRKA